jgi:hypothetical protein
MQPTATSIRMQSLLDRLDPRTSEPCTVPGCVHLDGPVHGQGVVVELQAA